MRLFVFARHAQSTLNHENRVNGDPAVPAPLTEVGREEARLLGLQVRELPLDLCLHTRFGRTAETATIAMTGRDVPIADEPLFDDVRIGELEGQTVEDYRAWKRVHTRSDSFPGGESLDETARRYVAAFHALLERPLDCCLVVCHEIPIRYALNGAAGSDDLDGPVHGVPNAMPFLFDEAALERAIERIDLLSAASETRSPR
jgi:broad specificity phosphatase PhoE